MLIKEMFMRSFENPEVIKTFMNWVLKIYTSIMNPIIALIIVSVAVSYIISLVVNTESKLTGKFNIKNLKKHFKARKKDIKERFTEGKVVEISKNRFLKIKPYLRKCRFLIIWYVLLQLSWYFVSLCFRFINKVKVIPDWNNICSEQELSLLWTRGLYTFLFFIIAPMFITFCFWNKFVRNIWVLIYILWIIFCFLGAFLNLGCYNITSVF